MPRLLVVDDDSMIVENTSEYFSRHNWKVTGAYDGRQALEVVGPSFDAVVLDLKMPVMGGEETLVEIKKRADLAGLCVVVLTAFGEVNSAVRSMRHGAYQYLEKPFELADLERVLVSGIALGKINSFRRQLLGMLDVNPLLDRISSILSETIIPDGPYLIFLGPDGSIQWIHRGVSRLDEGDIEQLKSVGPRRFIDEIRATNRPVFVGDALEVAKWGPILREAKSLLAAPIPASAQGIAGIIDLESTSEGAFDRNWEEVLVHVADLAGIAIEVAEKARVNAMLSARTAELASQKAQADLATERANRDALAERQTRENIMLLAREVGHRILTPVQVIRMQAETMIEKDLASSVARGLPARLKESLVSRAAVIRDGASEIDAVCVQLRDVSRETPVRIQALNLWDLLDASLEAHLSELDSKRIALTRPDEKWKGIKVRGDPGLLKYSLECLLRNAIEAIEKARIARKTGHKGRKRSAESDQITIAISLDPTQKRASISVSDTGGGVPQDYRDRLFVTLFSMKEPSASGLGLFSVNRYMKLQKGSVELAPSGGRGATFVLTLPISRPETNRRRHTAKMH